MPKFVRLCTSAPWIIQSQKEREREIVFRLEQSRESCIHFAALQAHERCICLFVCLSACL